MLAAAKPARTLRGGTQRDGGDVQAAPMAGRNYAQSPDWTDAAATGLKQALQAQVDSRLHRTLHLAACRRRNV